MAKKRIFHSFYSKDLSKILFNEFYRRQKKNPRYSLRKFSKDIQIDPSNLVRLRSGQAISLDSFFDAMKCAKVSPNLYVDALNDVLIENEQPIRVLSRDLAIALGSLPGHLLLGYLNCNPVFNALKISKTLGIPESFVQKTIDQLLNSKLIVLESNGKLRRMGCTLIAPPAVDKEALDARKLTDRQASLFFEGSIENLAAGPHLFESRINSFCTTRTKLRRYMKSQLAIQHRKVMDSIQKTLSVKGPGKAKDYVICAYQYKFFEIWSEEFGPRTDAFEKSAHTLG